MGAGIVITRKSVTSLFFSLNYDPVDHVLELNYQNQRALFAKILIIKFRHMVNRSKE